MKLLFLTPPMENWAAWGDRHLACNPPTGRFHPRKKGRAAEVEVLDCRALELNDEQMMGEIGRRNPDVVFFGTLSRLQVGQVLSTAFMLS